MYPATLSAITMAARVCATTPPPPAATTGAARWALPVHASPCVANLASIAIRALPPDQRAAIALHHFEGLSVAETAVALDAPVGTIKTRLMHARLKLKAALEGEIP